MLLAIITGVASFWVNFINWRNSVKSSAFYLANQHITLNKTSYPTKKKSFKRIERNVKEILSGGQEKLRNREKNRKWGKRKGIFDVFQLAANWASWPSVFTFLVSFLLYQILLFAPPNPSTPTTDFFFFSSLFPMKVSALLIAASVSSCLWDLSMYWNVRKRLYSCV